MSHLTDGEIHIHLDGALDLLPDRRTAEIREHLSRCEDCRARVEEERRIRERSSEILGSVGEGTDLPSFESLRERAAGGPGAGRSLGRSRESWYRGAAWAATVVLSLGLGWYARSGVVETDLQDQPILTSPTSPVGAGDAGGTGGAAGTPGPVGEVDAGGAEGTGGADRTTAAGDGGRELVAGGPAPAQGRESVPVADDATAVDRSLAVGGLPVVSVAWQRDPDLDVPAITIVQRLPSGDTLSLRYSALAAETATELADGRDGNPEAANRARPPEAESLAPTTEDAAGALRASGEPDVEADTPDSGPTPVTRRHGPWLLEARSTLDPDSVRVLLDRLPPP